MSYVQKDKDLLGSAQNYINSLESYKVEDFNYILLVWDYRGFLRPLRLY